MSAATCRVDDGSVEMTIGPDDAATLFTADDAAAAGRPAPSVDTVPEVVDERDRRAGCSRQPRPLATRSVAAATTPPTSTRRSTTTSPSWRSPSAAYSRWTR